MKYKFWDVSRDRKKKPITSSDRLLEWMAVTMGVCLLALTGVIYSQAPDTVPSHFNFVGEIDGWSDKEVYWIIALVHVIMMAICASAAYNRKLVNLPFRLKSAVFYRQIGLIGRMCRIMTLGAGFIWLSILLAMSSEIVGLPADVAISFIPMSVGVMLGVVLFYTLKIWWIGRSE